MTECVQRHDVAGNEFAEGEALLAEIDASLRQANREQWLYLAKLVGGLALFNALIYLSAVLA